MMRAGDVVKHGPTGETWTLAYADEVRGEVSACGWPESIAKMEHCTLVEAATDDVWLAMLHMWADTDHRHDNGSMDYRTVVCRRQLADLKAREVTNE